MDFNFLAVEAYPRYTLLERAAAKLGLSRQDLLIGLWGCKARAVVVDDLFLTGACMNAVQLLSDQPAHLQ